MPDYELRLLARPEAASLRVRNLETGSGRFILNVTDNLGISRATAAGLGNSYEVDERHRVKIQYPEHLIEDVSNGNYLNGNEEFRRLRLKIFEGRSDMVQLASLSVRIDDYPWQNILKVFPNSGHNPFDLRLVSPIVFPPYNNFIDCVGGNLKRVYIH